MIISWRVPAPAVEETESAFLRGQHEVFVLWTASTHDESDVCAVRRSITPNQRPGQTPSGVYVHIDGAELARIQFGNLDLAERSVVQLHTHPGSDVAMSALDRQWEVISHVGALSIIVPYYGRLGLLGFPGAAVYERESTDWRLWPSAETAQRIRVIE